MKKVILLVILLVMVGCSSPLKPLDYKTYDQEHMDSNLSYFYKDGLNYLESKHLNISLPEVKFYTVFVNESEFHYLYFKFGMVANKDMEYKGHDHFRLHIDPKPNDSLAEYMPNIGLSNTYAFLDRDSLKAVFVELNTDITQKTKEEAIEIMNQLLSTLEIKVDHKRESKEYDLPSYEITYEDLTVETKEEMVEYFDQRRYKIKEME